MKKAVITLLLLVILFISCATYEPAARPDINVNVKTYSDQKYPIREDYTYYFIGAQNALMDSSMESIFKKNGFKTQSALRSTKGYETTEEYQADVKEYFNDVYMENPETNRLVYTEVKDNIYRVRILNHRLLQPFLEWGIDIKNISTEITFKNHLLFCKKAFDYYKSGIKVDEDQTWPFNIDDDFMYQIMEAFYKEQNENKGRDGRND